MGGDSQHFRGSARNDKKTFYLNNKIMRSLPPERGINIVCLFISAGAPAVAIGPTVGTPTGLAIGLGLLAVIRAQSSASGTVRNTYFLGAWIIRIFSGAFEVMAYTDVFSARTSLPFELSPIVWAWATALFMAALDLWALQATATSARAAVEAAEYEDSLARADRLDRERHERKAQEEEAERAYQIQLARIQAETETRKAEAAANAQAEAAKAQAEAERKVAEAQAEARKVEAEARRKQAEVQAEAERKQAEERRKLAEVQADAERKRKEEYRKEREEKRKQEEAQRIEKERITREREQAAQREAEAKAEADRKFRQAEAEAVATSAEKRKRWQEAKAEERAQIVREAEAKAEELHGRKPTQVEVAQLIGISDRALREFKNQHSQFQKQAA